MPTRAQVTTPWVQQNQGGFLVNIPQVNIDHPSQTLTDVTGQAAANIPPLPNAVVVEGVWDDTTWAALAADPNYAAGILWNEPA